MRAITPPCFEVPAKLAWRKTSPERSTPGPLPYHIPNTPSNLPSPRSSACCEPQGGRRKFFIDAGLKLDVGRRELACGAYELLVEAAERRATIAGDIAAVLRPARR